MGNGALPNGPSYRAHPRLYLTRHLKRSSYMSKIFMSPIAGDNGLRFSVAQSFPNYELVAIVPVYAIHTSAFKKAAH
jgi:hypothetical protein